MERSHSGQGPATTPPPPRAAAEISAADTASQPERAPEKGWLAWTPSPPVLSLAPGGPMLPKRLPWQLVSRDQSWGRAEGKGWRGVWGVSAGGPGEVVPGCARWLGAGGQPVSIRQVPRDTRVCQTLHKAPEKNNTGRKR